MIDETNGPDPSDFDPRLRASQSDTVSEAAAALRPAVAGDARPKGLWLIAGGAVLLGLLVLWWLGSHRHADAASLRSVATASQVTASPPPPQEVATFEDSSRNPRAPTLVSMQTLPPPSPLFSVPPSTVMISPPSVSNSVALARQHAPALVVDLADAPPSAAAAPGGQAGLPGRPGAARPDGAADSQGGLNGDERFAERVGASEPERSLSTQLHNMSETVPQGAMIAGVLETALDSDLPGYARAVVSRDVRSFDGSTVLIPRGSRVIGQYKSAVAQGQSRAFVIWTRILRPDGASIQIASSGTDPLGRAGLEGSVDRHFLERFGGAILLSVVNAGVSSLAAHPSTQVVIGSTQEATGLAASALQPASISPTIKVPQGTPIRIFVARDLDFSPTGGIGH